MFAEIRGLQELLIKFDRAPGLERKAVAQAMLRATQLVSDQAKANMARLFHNPDRMQRSLSTTVDDGGDLVVGTVTASGLPYLRIQEYGGVVQTPDIFPVNAAALHWLMPAALGFSGGPASQGDVFAMHARAHTTRIPERSYLRAALAQKRAEVVAQFQGATTMAMAT